ncbi:MAG: T9SS type A sorting domain-containing protein [Bacteroidetes bacterium]|nr:T9SS type A sorting domain-containing protein [Bacteroidota bacterium]
MKRAIFTFLFIALFFAAFSQKLEWAYSFKNANIQDVAGSIASNGEEFAVTGTIVNNFSVDLKNHDDAFKAKKCFIARYDKNANIKWVLEQPGGGTNPRINTMTMDQEGNLYTSGFFSGTLDFDPSAAKSEYTAAGLDAFVQKLDKDGNLKWVAHTNTSAQPTHIALKSNGNVVILGRSQNGATATLDGGMTVTLEQGVFIVEVSADGKVIGAYSLATPASFSTAVALGITSQDEIVVAASVDGAMNIDLKGGNNWDTSVKAYDALIAVYSSTFEYKWHKVFGDIDNGQPGGWDAIRSIVCDKENNIYATGYFTWTTDFDPDKNPGSFVREAGTYNGSQSPDGFIIKYNSSGEIQWVQDMGGHEAIPKNRSADVNLFDMVLKDNHLVAYGEMSGQGDFDGSADTFMIRTKDYGVGLCFVEYTTNGTFENAWLADGVSSNEKSTGIELLSSGVVAFGTFNGSFDPDPTEKEYLLKTDSTGPLPQWDNDLFVVHYNLDFITDGIPVFAKTTSVYPNPTNGFIHINEAGLNGKKFEIINVNGTILKQGIIVNDIDLSDLGSGIYILSFPDSGYLPLRVVVR